MTPELLFGIGINTTRAVSGLMNLSTQLNKTGGKIKQVGKTAKREFFSISESIKTVRETIVREATQSALSFANADIIKIPIEFEATMSKVAAVSNIDTTTLAGANQLKEMSKTAREFASVSMQTATEVAGALKYLGLAGYSASEQLKALPGLLTTTTASGAQLEDVADSLSDQLTALGMDADELGKLGDMAVKTTTSANTGFTDLAEAAKYAAASFNAIDWDASDLYSSIGVMANSGIKGSMGGTAARSIASRLLSDMKPVKETLDNLGVTVINARGKIKSMPAVFEDLAAALDGLSQAKRLQSINKIFGLEASSGAMAVINAAKQYRDETGKVTSKLREFDKTLENSLGTGKKMSAIMGDNLRGDLNILSSTFQELILSIYDIIQPLLRFGTQTITEFLKIITTGVQVAGAVINSLTSYFYSFFNTVDAGASSLQGTISIFEIFVGILHTVGIGLKVLGDFLISFAGGKETLDDLGQAFVDLFYSSESLTSAFYNLLNLFETFFIVASKIYYGAISLITNIFMDLFNIITGGIPGITYLNSSLQNLSESSDLSLLGEFGKTLSTIFTIIRDFINEKISFNFLVTGFKQIADWVSTLAVSVGNSIAEWQFFQYALLLINQASQNVATSISYVIGYIRNIPNSLQSAGAHVLAFIEAFSFSPIFRSISELLSNIFNADETITSAIIGVGESLDTAKNAAVSFIKFFSALFLELSGDVLPFLSVLQDAVLFFGNMTWDLLEYWSQVSGSMKTGVSVVIGVLAGLAFLAAYAFARMRRSLTLTNIMEDVLKETKQFNRSMQFNLRGVASSIREALCGGCNLNEFWEEAHFKVKSLGGSIKSVFANAWSKVKEGFAKAWQNVTDRVESAKFAGSARSGTATIADYEAELDRDSRRKNISKYKLDDTGREYITQEWLNLENEVIEKSRRARTTFEKAVSNISNFSFKNTIAAAQERVMTAYEYSQIAGQGGWDKRRGADNSHITGAADRLSESRGIKKYDIDEYGNNTKRFTQDYLELRRSINETAKSQRSFFQSGIVMGAEFLSVISSKLSAAMQKISSIAAVAIEKARAVSAVAIEKVRTVAATATNIVRTAVIQATAAMSALTSRLLVIASLNPFVSWLIVGAIAATVIWNIKAIGSAVYSTISLISTSITSLASYIVNIIMGVLNLIPTAINAIGDALGKFVSTGLGNLVKSIGGLVQSIVDIIGHIFNAGLYVLQGDFKAAGTALISALGQGIWGALSFLKNVFVSVLQMFGLFLPHSDAQQGPLSDLTGSGFAIPKTLGEGVEQGEAALSGAMDKVMNTAFTSMIDSARSKMADFYSWIMPKDSASYETSLRKFFADAWGNVMGGNDYRAAFIKPEKDAAMAEKAKAELLQINRETLQGLITQARQLTTAKREEIQKQLTAVEHQLEQAKQKYQQYAQAAVKAEKAIVAEKERQAGVINDINQFGGGDVSASRELMQIEQELRRKKIEFQNKMAEAEKASSEEVRNQLIKDAEEIGRAYEQSAQSILDIQNREGDTGYDTVSNTTKQITALKEVKVAHSLINQALEFNNVKAGESAEKYNKLAQEADTLRAKMNAVPEINVDDIDFSKPEQAARELQNIINSFTADKITEEFRKVASGYQSLGIGSEMTFDVSTQEAKTKLTELNNQFRESGGVVVEYGAKSGLATQQIYRNIEEARKALAKKQEAWNALSQQQQQSDQGQKLQQETIELHKQIRASEELENRAQVEIKADISQAQQSLSVLKKELAGLDNENRVVSIKIQKVEGDWTPPSSSQGYATGGKVGHRIDNGHPMGTDTVKAWLTPGEWVINRSSSGMFNDILNLMNTKPEQAKMLLEQGVQFNSGGIAGYGNIPSIDISSGNDNKTKHLGMYSLDLRIRDKEEGTIYGGSILETLAQELIDMS